MLTVNLARLNGVADILGALPIHLAPDAVRSAKNLLHGTLELLRERLVPHDAGDVDDLIEGDRLVVLDVLLLLLVPGGLLQRLDDEGRSGRHNGHGGLAVLDRELDGHAETFLQARILAFAREKQKRPLRGIWARQLTQSPVALAISSPTFFGERPRGPILGASDEEAPISPPVARRVLYQLSVLGIGRWGLAVDEHDLDLGGVELGS